MQQLRGFQKFNFNSNKIKILYFAIKFYFTCNLYFFDDFPPIFFPPANHKPL